MKKYGIGIIGLGMGSTVIEVNNIADTELEVRGLCDYRSDFAEQLGKARGIPFTTDNYSDLLNQDGIDIIAVYSPDHLHGEHCIAALNAGKHVICTKPMVTKLEDAKEIVKLTKEKGIKFLTGQTMRYEPQFSTIKKMYDDGDLGNIIMAEAHYVHDMRPIFKITPWRLRVPQDFMYGGVCHPVDVLRWFLGDVEEVFCYAARGNLEPEYPLKGNFILSLKFKNGTIARILGAYDIVHPPMSMMGVTIYGTKASASGSFTDQQGGEVKVVHDKFELPTESIMQYPAEKEGAYGHGQTVLRYLEHFEECLENDVTPVPDAAEGAKSIAVCSAAWESVKSGKPEKVFNNF